MRFVVKLGVSGGVNHTLWMSHSFDSTGLNESGFSHRGRRVNARWTQRSEVTRDGLFGRLEGHISVVFPKLQVQRNFLQYLWLSFKAPSWVMWFLPTWTKASGRWLQVKRVCINLHLKGMKSFSVQQRYRTLNVDGFK